MERLGRGHSFLKRSNEPYENMPQVIANGEKLVSESIPCPLDSFLTNQGFLPKSVVVELNGEAVSPSEFKNHTVREGDRLEIVKIVAGG